MNLLKKCSECKYIRHIKCNNYYYCDIDGNIILNKDEVNKKCPFIKLSIFLATIIVGVIILFGVFI